MKNSIFCTCFAHGKSLSKLIVLYSVFLQNAPMVGRDGFSLDFPSI
jgi:hypothetical protein